MVTTCIPHLIEIQYSYCRAVAHPPQLLGCIESPCTPYLGLGERWGGGPMRVGGELNTIPPMCYAHVCCTVMFTQPLMAARSCSRRKGSDVQASACRENSILLSCTRRKAKHAPSEARDGVRSRDFRRDP